MSGGGGGSVGSLLADIANVLADALRIFSLADKRHWGPDEYEQIHALEDVLDEAKRDFQELSPLVNGQAQYQFDRTARSVDELDALRRLFRSHIDCLRDWCRSGGLINPMWIRETHNLQKQLHRAQCRVAGRIFASAHEDSERCLGATLVRRQQQAGASRRNGSGDHDTARQYLEELAVCNIVGSFKRFGEEDIAFICDFCDGHMVWENLERMPTLRAAHQEAANSAVPPASPSANNPQWQARGVTLTDQQEKIVVFAPAVIANHLMPRFGDWQSELLCSYCEDEAAQPQDEDDDEDAYKPEYRFDDMFGLQEHLEWWHNADAAATTVPLETTSSGNCQIM